MEFKDLELSKNVLKAIDKLGYTKPSPIQEKLIPLVLKGEDLIGQAQTGTGKTLAYAASILSSIDVKGNDVKAIVLVPTRELAMQVAEEFKNLNDSSDFNIVPVFGGSSVEKQVQQLRRGADVVVGTPGRVMDLMRRKRLNIDELKYFILDEADEMLDMGFQEDIESIFEHTNKNKQVLMLSATMPKAIESLATKYMRADYEHIEIKSETKTASTVTQYYYLVSEKTRMEALCRILDLKNSKKTIVFCQTKSECDDLLTQLAIRGYNAEAMHGDITQDMRIKTLGRFKQSLFNILVATDVAARGIHVDNVDCVINYRLPEEKEAYIHRIGRTGRAEELGEAISLVNNREIRRIEELEKYTNATITKNELPTQEEISKLKYEIILKEAINVDDNTAAVEYIRDYNKTDLMNLAASLLTLTVNKETGSDFTRNVEVKEEKRSTMTKDCTRVFITIGKKDGLKKGSLLDFLKEQTNIRKENFNNIEILNTYTFIDVNSKVVKDFIAKITGKKYKSRQVRIEIANRQK